MPADVAELFKQVEHRSNVYAIVLDGDGKFVHGFPALPPKRDPDYFKTELAKAKLEFPKDRPVVDRLPDGKGMRIFIRCRSELPIVEMVERKDWTIFAYPGEEREIDASELRDWFAHLYPPAIRTEDQSKPFKSVTGKLKLRPAGKDHAILGGEFRMTKGDDGESAFEGSLGAVITYKGGAFESFRGTVDGVYLYRQRETQRIPLTAALESR